MFTTYERAKEEVYRQHQHVPQRDDPQFQNLNLREQEEEIDEEFINFNPLYHPNMRWRENFEPDFGFEFPNPFATMVS